MKKIQIQQPHAIAWKLTAFLLFILEISQVSTHKTKHNLLLMFTHNVGEKSAEADKLRCKIMQNILNNQIK